MPRLRRARLDLPLARAARARLSRLRAAREPRPARRGVGGRRPLLPRRARRGGRGRTRRTTEAELREIRYSYATDCLRATGHTASDNVETVLYRLVSSGRPGGIKPKREDGVVRPLLTVWREETEAYCDGVGLPYRTDSTNVDTKRGLIRTELLPLLERLDPRARANLLALAEQPAERRLPRTLERDAARPALVHGRHEGGRPRPGHPRGARIRPADARARACPLRPVDDRIGLSRARGAHVAARRPPRRPQPQGAGRLHRREGAATRACDLAARRSRERGCLDPRDRGQSQR